MTQKETYINSKVIRMDRHKKCENVKRMHERLSVKIELTEEDLRRFYELKRLLGLKQNTEVVRVAIKLALPFVKEKLAEMT